MEFRRSAFLLAFVVISASMVAFAAPKRPNRGSCTAWQDTFSSGQLDSRWLMANERAPGYIEARHIGYFQPSNVSLAGGLLTLRLTQQLGTVDGNTAGVVSYGGMIYTKATCGYGTYEWTMKMSSTASTPTSLGNAVSGSVSAGFIYVNNSQTEIDFEFSAAAPSTLWFVNWLNPNPSQDPTEANETYTPLAPFDSISGFHTYRFVWSPGKISYYVDGIWKADHTTNVPTAPAAFMINHWGTDGPYWGGWATLGVTRYFYITRASFTPAN